MTVTPNEIHAHHDQMQAESTARRRPRWLVPALAIGGVIAAALVISGFVSASLILYAGILASCGLMHLLGHGGHGGGTPPAAR